MHILYVKPNTIKHLEGLYTEIKTILETCVQALNEQIFRGWTEANHVRESW